MVGQPQANPKPHPVDFLALGLLVIAAAAQFSDQLPPKYSGALMAAAFAARLYTKWLGTQQDQAALAQGEQAGQELKKDYAIFSAKPAEPVNPTK